MVAYLLLDLPYLLHLLNNGAVASALFVVNGGTKVPLVATGTGVLSYNTRELFPV